MFDQAKFELAAYAEYLSSKSDQILKDHTTNWAENVMSLIGKMNKGKSENRVMGDRYSSDVMVARLRHNYGAVWGIRAYKKFFYKRPLEIAKKKAERTKR